MALSPIQTFANREVAELTFCDYTTQKPILYFPWANTTAAGLTGGTVAARGGWGAPKRIFFADAREGTLTVETQINCAKLYALATGGNLSNTAEILKRTVITASEGLTLPTEKSGTISEHGITVFPITDDGGVEIADVSLVDGVVIGDGITDGEQYAVYYMVKHDGDVQRLNITGRSVLRDLTIHGLTLMKDETGVEHQARMICYKAAAQSNVDFSYSNQGDPATMTLTFDLAANANGDVLDIIFMDEGL